MSDLSDDISYLAERVATGKPIPTKSALQDWIEGQDPYPENGTVLFTDPLLGTVTLVDRDSGRVHISAADENSKGALFCAYPATASLDPKGKGFATVDENTARAASGFDFYWARVCPVVPQDSASRAFVLAPPVNGAVPWFEDSWTIPPNWPINRQNAVQSWPDAIDYAKRFRRPTVGLPQRTAS